MFYSLMFSPSLRCVCFHFMSCCCNVQFLHYRLTSLMCDAFTDKYTYAIWETKLVFSLSARINVEAQTILLSLKWLKYASIFIDHVLIVPSDSSLHQKELRFPNWVFPSQFLLGPHLLCNWSWMTHLFLVFKVLKRTRLPCSIAGFD